MMWPFKFFVRLEKIWLPVPVNRSSVPSTWSSTFIIRLLPCSVKLSSKWIEKRLLSLPLMRQWLLRSTRINWLPKVLLSHWSIRPKATRRQRWILLLRFVLPSWMYGNLLSTIRLFWICLRRLKCLRRISMRISLNGLFVIYRNETRRWLVFIPTMTEVQVSPHQN